MRVRYFWAQPWQEARDLLDRHAPGYQPVWTGAGLYSYWEAMAAEWGGGDGLVTIEQDIGIHGDVIPQFAECDQPWCTFGYQVGAYICTVTTGCARFSAEAMRLTGHVFLVRAPVGECADCAAACWHHLDTVLCGALTAAGISPHVHSPDVRHLRMET